MTCNWNCKMFSVGIQGWSCLAPVWKWTSLDVENVIFSSSRGGVASRTFSPLVTVAWSKTRLLQFGSEMSIFYLVITKIVDNTVFKYCKQSSCNHTLVNEQLFILYNRTFTQFCLQALILTLEIRVDFSHPPPICSWCDANRSHRSPSRLLLISIRCGRQKICDS